MDSNQSNGIKIIIIATILTVFLVILNPKDQLMASAAVGTLFAFGGILASGHWPYQSKRPRRRRIGQSRIDFWLQPIKDLIYSKHNPLKRD